METLCGAGYRERTTELLNHRNDYRSRLWDTRARVRFATDYRNTTAAAVVYNPALFFYNSVQAPDLDEKAFVWRVHAGADYALGRRLAMGVEAHMVGNRRHRGRERLRDAPDARDRPDTHEYQCVRRCAPLDAYARASARGRRMSAVDPQRCDRRGAHRRVMNNVAFRPETPVLQPIDNRRSRRTRVAMLLATRGSTLLVCPHGRADPFYAGVSLGGNVSGDVTLRSRSNDRANICDEHINPSALSVPGCTAPDRGAGDGWAAPFDGGGGFSAEAELGYRFSPRFRVAAVNGYNATEFDQTVSSTDASGVDFDKIGNELSTGRSRWGPPVPTNCSPSPIATGRTAAGGRLSRAWGWAWRGCARTSPGSGRAAPTPTTS